MSRIGTTTALLLALSGLVVVFLMGVLVATGDEGELPPTMIPEADASNQDPPPQEPTASDPEVEIPPGLAEDDCGLEVLASQEEVGGNLGTPGQAPVDAVKPGFAIQVKDEVIPYGLMSLSALPGESVSFEAVFTEERSELSVTAELGELERIDDDHWIWTAPDEPGSGCVTVRDVVTDDSLCLQIFVMRPYGGEEVLNGYRIGEYQREPLGGREAYEMPRGLIEVTEETVDTWVSPHFRLRQFLCKQQPDAFPKYLILETRLLMKLEMLLERLREQGIDAHTFYMMSAYRTPWYNASIGNRTIYSRHAYGDAADIFVDLDGNRTMDDLDGDDSVTTGDARILAGLVKDAYGETWYMPFVGGLGVYGPAAHRGPFIHVDTRGYRARW
ncbi:MAG: hypothetical protein R3234_02115 [Thermoanaerobaculia bacterium]|nr:hypothetical protein [Thermoanaerobaculia bacterium]